MVANMNRRKFLVSAAAVGGAFTLGVQRAPEASAMPTRDIEFPKMQRDTDLGAWIAILPDNKVIVRSPMPENGNGVMTQVAMTISEELRCDLALVEPEFASPTRNHLEDGVYDESGGDIAFFAGRSTSAIRNQVLLQAGASARERLKTAAANTWGVELGQVEAENSILTNTESGDTLTYGDVALEAASVELSEEPELKPEADWTILGKQSLGKYHTPLVVKGEAIYGIDVMPENLLHATLRQYPVQGGRLVSYDFDAIKDMPGVHSVVEVDPDNPAPEGAAPFFYGMKSKTGAARNRGRG